MPLYEFRCKSCEKVFEAYKRPSDDVGAERCPLCGKESARVGISLVSAKGSGSSSPAGGSSCGSGPRRSPFG